jgi:putative endonuclease
MKYFLYILKSVKDEKYYVGITDDVARRLKEHNLGYNKSTKPYRPYNIVHLEEFKTKEEAAKKEWWIKNKPEGRWYKKRILKNK